MADDVYSKGQFVQETLTSLGAELQVGGINIPPPTPAVIPLLELINSPFVCGFENIADDNNDDVQDDIKLKDVLDVLYIFMHKEKAVEPVFIGHRRTMLLEKTKEIAEKNSEMYTVYLKALEASAKDWSEFDNQVMKFASSLGKFNYIEVSAKIQLYLTQAWMGFEMIPKSATENFEKKNITSGQTG